MNKKAVLLFSALFLIAGLLGCPKKPQKPPEKITPVETPETETTKEEPTIRGVEFKSIPEIKPVYFGYEKYDLTVDSTKVLQKNAEYLKAHPELEVLVEGNCCECGTNEYNLALGQKRAQSVRGYYSKLGVSAGNIGTISFGEEKPIKPDAGPPDSPDCALNRHADTKVRSTDTE